MSPDKNPLTEIISPRRKTLSLLTKKMPGIIEFEEDIQSLRTITRGTESARTDLCDLVVAA